MPDQATELTNQHRAAQFAIANELVTVLRRLWRLLDLTNPRVNQKQWATAAIEALLPFRSRSVDAAVDYLVKLRAVEHRVDRSFVPVRAPEMDPQVLMSSLIQTGPVRVEKANLRVEALTLDDATKARRLTQLHDEAFVTSTAAAQRHVVNGGRSTVVATTEKDTAALGWIRVSDGAPCSFCAMLISRGPVYRSNSFARSNAKFKSISTSDPRYLGPGEFKAHDFDGCTLKPVYSNDDPAVLVAERLSDAWAASTRGLSGKEATAAFRAAYTAD